jgi:hypothetical protein
MQYAVWLHKGDDLIWFEESLLPGFIPDHVIDMMRCERVERDLKLCHHVKCEQAYHCHVLMRVEGDDHTFDKLCPVLFHDIVKPDWELSEL